MIRWFGKYICISGKRFMRRRSFFLSLLLLPCLIFGIGKLSDTQTQEWRVGLYSEETGLAEETIKALCRQQQFLQFYRCESLEELQRDVQGKYAECGFYFQRGFEEAFYNEMEQYGVTIYYAPSSVAQKMAREEVFANILASANETLLTNFLTEQVGDFSWEELHGLYQRYTESGNIFHASFEEIGSDKEQHQANQMMLSPVRGLLALFILAEILFAVLLFYEDEAHGITKNMMKQQRTIFKATTLFIPALCSLLCTYVVLAASGCLREAWGEEILLLGAYATLCMIFSLCLFNLCKSASVYVCTVTVLLAASVIICPVFLSVSSIFPKLDWIQFILLPGAYLSKIMTGKNQYLLGQFIIYLFLFVVQKGIQKNGKFDL